jgi:HD-like signal output (HDOD) protein/ActR/RegA family two-component response regulator
MTAQSRAESSAPGGPTRPHILFVDDEDMLLDALRRVSDPLRARWSFTFASSGKEAIAHLREGNVHVLVTDLAMPVMDGTALLEHTRAHHPDVIRIILSGSARAELTVRATALAHKVLDKPCPIGVLQSGIERSLALRDRLRGPALRRLVQRLYPLPSVPDVYAKICAAMEHPRDSIAEVAALVEEDVGLRACVLTLASSMFVEPGRSLSDVRDAVACLGIHPIRALVLDHTVSALLCPTTGFALEFALEDHQRHARLAAGIAADVLREDPQQRSAAVTASLLKDVGQTLMRARLEALYAYVVVNAERAGRTPSEVEQQVLGTTHAELGAYLAALWGLPDDVVEAIANHHVPSTDGRPSLVAMQHRKVGER